MLWDMSTLGLRSFLSASAWLLGLLPALPSLAADGVRERELVRLVREDCGSCHGIPLKGGLGPALLPETLQDKPDQSLVLTILQGRPGTPMPPWQPFLSEGEAAWIVARLKAGFPEMQAFAGAGR